MLRSSYGFNTARLKDTRLFSPTPNALLVHLEIGAFSVTNYFTPEQLQCPLDCALSTSLLVPHTNFNNHQPY